MEHKLMRAGSMLVLALAACSAEQPPSGPSLGAKTTDLTGLQGGNCDGVAAAMVAPDGTAQAAQSIIRLYNLKLHGEFTKLSDQKVLHLSLPTAFEQTDLIYREWLGKSGNIFRSQNALAYGGGNYYPGVFGFLDEVDVPEGTCSGEVLTDQARNDGTLAQVGLSQAGQCGMNPNGTPKFNQVNQLDLVPINSIVDGQVLIDIGLAAAVTSAPAERCIIPDVSSAPSTTATPTTGSGTSPDVPCRVAWASAVTEGVVLGVPSLEVLDGIALGMRPFTAAGTVAMPNGLDLVRTVVRSSQFRAMYAIGLPMTTWLGGTLVQITGHRIGPAQSPSSVLRPEERAYIDQLAGVYSTACCHQECTATSPTPTSTQLVGGDPLATGTSGGGTCTNVCIPEGQCETGILNQGLIVMVSANTTTECNGPCPEPSASAPSETPTCSL
jgi:hypothetical protein